MAQIAATAVVSSLTIEDVNTRKSLTDVRKLEDQAAVAALYATSPSKQGNANNRNGYDILDADHKLSSAGAAASLKYAKPHDLPSYPSIGLQNNNSAASAAASIGWSNQKPFQHWKPGPSPSASAAAMHAKNYKMTAVWQPDQSECGAKAAMIAHRDACKVEIWQPEPTAWSNSAANQALKKGNTLSPQSDDGHTEIGRRGSLIAATGAMSLSRKRAESQPVMIQKTEAYPDEANAVANALSAATSAHRTSSKRSNLPLEVGSTPYTTLPREMFTSHPPVAPEVEEQNRINVLRASAIAMAKQMYNYQQKQIDAATNAHAQSGAHAVHRRTSTNLSGDEIPQIRFGSLQEAAHKLAEQRLAKLHDEHAQTREYRDYYNTELASSYPQKSRLPLRGRARRRASSEGSYDDDRRQSKNIRAQKPIFSNNATQKDEKKRQQDREALIATAQRNVTKSLHGMDERVFADTGRVAPSLLSEWEIKAHAAAKAKSESRMENYGKVDIGCGKFVDQSAVDLAAQRNVQPVLDRINEKAAIEHERQAALRADRETEKRKVTEKKVREKEEKEITKRLKRDDNDERKAHKAEEKRIGKETRKSIGAVIGYGVMADNRAPTPEPEVSLATIEKSTEATGEQPPTSVEGREVNSTLSHRHNSMEQASSNRSLLVLSPSNAPKDSGKVKGWLHKLRRSSKSQKTPSSTFGEGENGPELPFLGGAALTRINVNTNTASPGALSLSSRQVAMSGAETGESSRETATQKSEEPVSPISDAGGNEDDEFQEARDNFDEDLVAPPTFATEKTASPTRTAKFTEEI